MKFVSWNVNGIRACVKKGFVDVFQELDADVFCIQESKLQAGQLDLDMPGYHQYWNYAVKKGYSGTAIFTTDRTARCREWLGHTSYPGRYCISYSFSSCMQTV